MPELPDVRVYLEALDRYVAGRRLEHVRIVALPPPVLTRRADVEQNEEAMGGGRLEQLDLEGLARGAGGGFPVQATRAVAGSIVADPNAPQRILEQPLPPQGYLAGSGFSCSRARDRWRCWDRSSGERRLLSNHKNRFQKRP